jgi:hypothetical protein
MWYERGRFSRDTDVAERRYKQNSYKIKACIVDF